MNHPCAVIFDMDGLMVDTEELAIDAWQEAGSLENHEISRELCIGMIGLNQRDSERFLVRVLGPDFPIERVRHHYLRILEKRLDEGRIDPKPGLYGLLDYLESHSIDKAVATSSARNEAIKKLRAVGVYERFPVIVTAEQVARGKPEPDIFLLAAQSLSADPACCAVLEDSEAGIIAAHAAGMSPLMVPDIKPPSDLTRSLAREVFSSLDDVRRFLMEMLDAEKKTFALGKS